MRTFLLASLLLVSWWLPARARAAGSIQSALPPHASLLAQVGIPGRSSSYAVVYRAAGLHLAVVQADASGDRVVWRRGLPGAPASLSAPGPSGLFQGVIKATSDRRARFFAYTLRLGAVSSAIDGQKSGTLAADEGIRVTPTGFVIRARDTGHVGSVAYRIVTRYAWTAGLYRETGATRAPDYPAGQEPLPNGTVRTVHGDTILVRLEVANTELEREQGLMYRKSLDADSGMVFVWTQPVLESFWMENTYIPLSVAFLGADGRIQVIQDMAPLTTDLHTPARPYLYAIETNQGLFKKYGIGVGDKVNLHGVP